MAGTCPNCASVMPEGAQFCSGCGAAMGGTGAGSLPPPPLPEKKSNTLVIVLVCVGAAFFLCLGLPIIAAIAIPNLLAAKLSSNETAAMATLRNLASCQAQIQTSGKIDADGDGIGEYGTLLEMTGTTGVRKGFRSAAGGEKASSGFESQGSTVTPPILSAALANVDGLGIVTKNGYCYVIFLPDSSMRGGWVHEKGPIGSPGLEGGSGRIGVDASEERWCAYAWPVARGNSGNRCFFVNQEGDVLQSPNDVAKHQGLTRVLPPDSAFPAHRPPTETSGRS